MSETVVNKAHLGREFEQMLEQAHEVYATQRIASVRKHPVEWRYTSGAAYDKMSGHRQDLVARTNTGRYLTRVKSNIDFSGVAAGRHVAFDAKQVSRLNYPLDNLPEHQLNTLLAVAECGAIAGLMIYFSTYERAFFVPANYVDRCCKEMAFGVGKKSISLADCEQNGTEIKSSPLIQFDWFAAIVN